METELKFKTKTGFCHILNDKIILTNTSKIEDLKELSSKNNIYKVLIPYFIISIFTCYTTYKHYKNENWWYFGIFCILSVLFIYSVIRSLKLSSTPIIDIKKIKEIEFKPAIKFLTRSYFKIKFEEKDGKKKTRLIMLPGSLSNGSSETKKALTIMKNSGLTMKT